MDRAWCNHDPRDGDVGVETLARLGKIVEATGVAVVDALLLSGRFLEEEREVACPESTLPVPDVTRGNHQQECITRYADNVDAIPGGDVDAVVAVQTSDGGVCIVVDEARGEAAMMTKRAGVDAIGGATGLLAQNIMKVVDEEAETEGPTLARAFRTLARESTEAIHEVEPFGTQTITQWDGGEFHEVEQPALVSGDTARCEHVNLDVCRWDGRMYLVLTGKDLERSRKRPLEVCDVGAIVDILEIWMSRYGKPAAVYTDEGALFGGSFMAWCG